MSRRTSEASKAIRTAWLKEQELVSEGRGTRDWTAEQQEEILKLGKAYYHSEIRMMLMMERHLKVIT